MIKGTGTLNKLQIHYSGVGFFKHEFHALHIEKIFPIQIFNSKNLKKECTS